MTVDSVFIKHQSQEDRFWIRLIHRVYLWTIKRSFEQKVIFFVISCHVIVLLCSILPRFKHVDDLKDLQTTWILEVEAGSQSLTQDVQSDPKKLPQLPKNFSVKDQKTDLPIGLGDSLQDPDLVKKEGGVELDLKKAMDRLKKEHLRLQTQERKKEKTTGELTKKIEGLKKLAEIAREQSTESSLKGLHNHPFIQIIRKKVMSHYSIPRYYEGQKYDHPVVRVILSSDGSVSTLDLLTSSRDDMIDNLVLQAIKKASPFENPPESLVHRELAVRFTLP